MWPNFGSLLAATSVIVKEADGFDVDVWRSVENMDKRYKIIRT